MKFVFHIPKCPYLSIPEPPSNQELLTYFYLSEQFPKIQFELGDPVIHSEIVLEFTVLSASNDLIPGNMTQF